MIKKFNFGATFVLRLILAIIPILFVIIGAVPYYVGKGLQAAGVYLIFFVSNKEVDVRQRIYPFWDY